MVVLLALSASGYPRMAFAQRRSSPSCEEDRRRERGVTRRSEQPCVIERVRTCDRLQGRSNILDLRPGTYEVTSPCLSFTSSAKYRAPCTSGDRERRFESGGAVRNGHRSGASPVVDSRTHQAAGLGMDTMTRCRRGTVDYRIIRSAPATRTPSADRRRAPDQLKAHGVFTAAGAVDGLMTRTWRAYSFTVISTKTRRRRS